ncbi:MAG: hypothetical protein ACLFV7_09725 [Phycisphaerae bacterium]
MEYTDRQYQRVAAYLDGEPIELTGQERTLAEELPALETELEAALTVEMPPRTREEIRRRMTAELARPTVRWGRVLRVFAAAAVVAVVASAALLTLPGEKPDPPRKLSVVSYEQVTEVTRSEALAAELELIAEEVDQLEADMLASATGTGDYTRTSMGVDAADEELNEFWTDDPFEGLGG